MKKANLIISALILIGALYSCKSDDPTEEICDIQLDLSGVDQTLLKQGQAEIDAYLEQNSVITNEEVNGMKYAVVERGSGVSPEELCDEVAVEYDGKVLGETESFDSGTTSFPLANLILGWQMGISELSVGDRAIFYIPSEYAYGKEGRQDSNGNYIIPQNANLIFVVELFGVR